MVNAFLKGIKGVSPEFIEWGAYLLDPTDWEDVMKTDFKRVYSTKPSELVFLSMISNLLNSTEADSL